MKDIREITAGDITAEFIEEQAAEWKESAGKAMEAAEAYLSDVQSRKATLQTQQREYDAALNKIKKERADIADRIVDLSSRGQIEEAAEDDAYLETLDREIAGIGRKLRVLSVADPKGDANLYKTAKDAYDAMGDHRTTYRERIGELQQIVSMEIARLETMSKELSYAMDRDPGQYAANKYNLAYRHFHDLDRADREAAERAAADRKAKEKEKGATRYTMV